LALEVVDAADPREGSKDHLLDIPIDLVLLAFGPSGARSALPDSCSST
jgi:hypothetical protein